jgi:uncharacterized protein YlxW (UPF0749 family)
MLNNFKTSLIRLYGRLKKMVSDLLLQIGAVCIPLGVLIAMFAYQFFEGLPKIVFGICGFIVFLFGVWGFSKVMQLARLELDASQEKDKKAERERTEDNIKFIALINEISGLRKDLTKRGENDDKPKPDPKT